MRRESLPHPEKVGEIYLQEILFELRELRDFLTKPQPSVTSTDGVTSVKEPEPIQRKTRKVDGGKL